MKIEPRYSEKSAGFCISTVRTALYFHERIVNA